MTYLLDVNVLIALIDTDHVNHLVAHEWFEHEGQARWATCPLTENGLIRIVSSSRYRNAVESPAAVLGILNRLTMLDGYERWNDDVTLTDGDIFVADRLLTSAQVTDTYLLGLAVHHGGKLATLDRRLSPAAVIGGREALHVI